MSVRLQARNLRRYALVPLYPLVWPVAYLVPRRKGLWLFAYAFGFKDNPRYLFEHVVATAPTGVRAVWVAQTQAEADAVAALGHEAVWKRTPRGWYLNLRAGAVVLGSGPSELNRPLFGRTTIVQTWHGAPFKRIHADFPQGDELLPGSGRVARLVNSVVRRATNVTRSRVGMIPSQSQVVASRFQSAFQVGPDAVPVLGTPRADVIGRTGAAAEAEAREVRDGVLPAALRGARHLVLYAPTWRDGADESSMAEGLDPAALDAVLERHDAVLLFRLHPQGDATVFDRAGLEAAERVVMGGAGGGSGDLDVNVLLRAVSCLITDYSAISVDYALLDRPIVYFMPDLESYEAGRGLYESPSLLTGPRGHATTWAEVVEMLDEALTDPERYAAAARGAADRYWAHHDERSCERITAAMLQRVGLARA